MTNIFAFHSVGESLRIALDTAYRDDPLPNKPTCTFRLLSSADMAGEEEIDNTLSLYVYRVTMNEHLRTRARRTGPLEENVPLSVDLHFLVTAWAKTVLTEQTILAWTMRYLQQHPVLDRASLTADAAWNPEDSVQVIPAELSTEDVMRIWDALEPSYRLSVSYVARVVRIDTDARSPGMPVVASRFTYTDRTDNGGRSVLP